MIDQMILMLQLGWNGILLEAGNLGFDQSDWVGFGIAAVLALLLGRDRLQVGKLKKAASVMQKIAEALQDPDKDETAKQADLTRQIYRCLEDEQLVRIIDDAWLDLYRQHGLIPPPDVTAWLTQARKDLVRLARSNKP